MPLRARVLHCARRARHGTGPSRACGVLWVLMGCKVLASGTLLSTHPGFEISSRRARHGTGPLLKCGCCEYSEYPASMCARGCSSMGPPAPQPSGTCVGRAPRCEYSEYPSSTQSNPLCVLGVPIEYLEYPIVSTQSTPSNPSGEACKACPKGGTCAGQVGPPMYPAVSTPKTPP